MEILGGLLVALLVLGLAALIIVLPIVAMVRSGRALRDATVLRGELARLREELSALRAAPPGPVLVPPPIVVETPAPTVEAPPPTVEAPPPAETPVVAPPTVEAPPPAETPPPVESAPVEPPPTEPPPPSVLVTPPPPVVIAPPVAATDGGEVPPEVLAARMREAAGAGKSPPPPSTPKAPPSTLEEKIGLVWFTRIGAVAVLLGVAYFYKYAVDNNWIGPWGRVAIGALVGAGILAFAELTRATTKAVWTQVALGVGLAFLLLTAYASHVYYHLVPVEAAFGAFFIISLLGGALAMHHEAEAILIVSLSAALAAPVLLSRGEDRPLALFSYVLVVTSLSHVASVKQQFRWSMWLGIAGTLALFIGWHARFFDAHPAPVETTIDVPPAALEGAYLHLAARAVPLAAVSAFFVQWIVLYAFARRGRERMWPTAILVAAALLAHAGYASLLFDRPLILGAILSVLGGVGGYLLRRENRSHLLAIPLGASFLVLVGTVHRAAGTQPIPMLALLAVWASIYVASFLRGQLANGKPSAGTLGLLGGVGFGFAILTSTLLARHHPLGYAGVLVALSALYGLLGVAAQAPVVHTAAVVFSFAFLLQTTPHALGSDAETNDFTFIGMSALWAGSYLASIAWDLFRRREAPTAFRLAAFSAAGLFFVYLAFSATVDGATVLRAAIVGAVGVVDLLAGAALLRRETAVRGAATVLLGQALALFAAATAFLLSGAAITVVWAALAAVVVWLAARDRDPFWLAGGLALFGAVLIRVLGIDLPAPDQATRAFMNTQGREGQLVEPLFVNQRAIALVASGVALLVAGRASRRGAVAGKPAAGFFSASGATLASIAHVLLLVFCVTEVHALARIVPPPPTGRVDDSEWFAFMKLYAAAQIRKEQVMGMLTTLVMGLYAAMLLGVGFGWRDRLHRLLGLGLFAFTLGKLGLWDVWRLAKLYQILVLVGVGALLLGAGFLYARFGKRLLSLLKDGNVGAAVVLVAALGLSGSAHAFDVTALKHARPIEGVEAPGYHRVEVDPALYRKSANDAAPLADLRIAGPDGREVPYFVREVPIVEPPTTHTVRLVDPVRLKDGSVQAVFDLGRAGLKHDRVILTVDGATFFRKTKIEISQDEREWKLLSEGAFIYRVGSASSTAVRYPTSDARYLRVTILPGAETVSAILDGRVAWAPAASDPPLRTIALAAPKRAEENKRTYLTWDLGEPGLPVTGLRLQISTPRFERRVEVSGTNYQGYWAPVTSAWIWSAPRDAVGMSALRRGAHLVFAPTRKRFVRVEIENGDDAPLAVDGAEAEWRAEEIVFRADAAGAHTLYVGGALERPQYDLAAVLAHEGNVQLAAARFGAFRDNERFGTGAAPPQPWSDRNRIAIAIVLGVVLGALALWTFRLLRRAKPKES
jgi:type II secretory pathway pseudopilin PulG